MDFCEPIVTKIICPQPPPNIDSVLKIAGNTDNPPNYSQNFAVKMIDAVSGKVVIDEKYKGNTRLTYGFPGHDDYDAMGVIVD